ncbi:MAG: hypothetical protein PHH10_01745 [Dysgonamonadaceae bacterium]|nr:hypothetical protein [Dysgonamonadaceae bacterium]
MDGHDENATPPKNSKIVLDIFKQISKDFNQTIITATRDNDFAKASDRVNKI